MEDRVSVVSRLCRFCELLYGPVNSLTVQSRMVERQINDGLEIIWKELSII
jgi:hypothetical protein